ncbi:ABC transporter ATP-binding protein [Plantactinospora sp. KBS50]|uniref:ABC transporter ATP-binding protein n=1 Tax=Plantactinospora sp. KBS50 TaxID=2024580 RepID=UPI000BAB0197|nr:ABC transporter ATP-binding protein [Plantactinospora sp. KBS50]ASW53130.1 ABC transporter ATP-binding protein [Plantactinospora sp. KBS50]
MNTSVTPRDPERDVASGRRAEPAAGARSLTLRGLRKTYLSRGRRSFEAVKGIDLHIEAGSLVALLGPSGCGKTTTLRMIAGLETVTGGDIRIGDQSVAALPAGRRNIGVGFESYALYPPLNVRENLAYGLRARKVRDADRRVDHLAARLEMTELLPLRPAALSSGQKQRVALARALIRNPPVLLLDEPLSHLDAGQRQRVRRELKMLQREFGYTTIVVTHDQLEALSLADQIAVMNAGVIVQFGTPDEIFDDPATVFVADFVGEPKINLLPGVVEHRDGRVLARVGAAGSLLTGCATAEPGRRVVVGIRPQDCQVGLPVDAPGLSGSVRAFANLLEFGQLSVDVPGVDAPVDVLTDAHTVMRPGEPVRFAAPAARVYLFDTDSGERLR